MSATLLAWREAAWAAAGPGAVGRFEEIEVQVSIVQSKASPHRPGIQNWASSGEDTAATGAVPERSTGEREKSIETPWSGLSGEPARSSQRPSQPLAWSCVIRPVS